MTTKSLWGEIPTSDTVVPPVTILRKQATDLGRLTNNVLTGDVSISKVPGLIEAYLWIVAPALGNYRYKLLTIRHDVTMYPLEIIAAFWSTWRTCNNEEEFVSALEQILSSAEAKKIVVSLLAQSRA